MHLRLVRVAVRLCYGHGIDAALASAGKRAPTLVAPLLRSIHQEAQDASSRHAHATRYSNYLLYWYTRASTDAEAATASGADEQGAISGASAVSAVSPVAKSGGALKERCARTVWLETLVKSVSPGIHISSCISIYTLPFV